MLLDPIYPVFHPVITKWLNRLVLLAEIAVFAQYGLYHHYILWSWDSKYTLMWKWPLYIVACLVAMGIINAILRKLWEVILVLIYGTADEEEIVRAREERLNKRQQNMPPRWERKQPAIKADGKVYLPDRVNGKPLTREQRVQQGRQLLRELN